jgi:hypothetical protein
VTSPFNTPLETGVRSLTILDALFPHECDLHRLVTFDYFVVHSGDAGGPRSIHAPLPLRSAELLVRRGLVERGLLLMQARGLVARELTENGFFYRATEFSTPFLSSLQASYLQRVRERASWVAETFGAISDIELAKIVREFFDEWRTEFQPVELPLTGES